jgi:hypothetical protein
MTTLADFNAKVLDRTQDSDNLLSSADRDDCVRAGVDTYARHRPRVLVADVSGVTAQYDYALPATWVSGFSTLQQVEYPAGSREPAYLEAEDYLLYQTTTTTLLRFLTTTPQTGQTIRLTFTARHTVDGSGSTIPAADENAVADLGASVACEWLSSRFSQQGEPTLGADSADHTSKARDFALRAKAFRERAYEHLGIPLPGAKGGQTASAPVAAASAVRDWDSDLSTGEDRLTHPRRRR